jgi:hypothetical protein
MALIQATPGDQRQKGDNSVTHDSLTPAAENYHVHSGFDQPKITSIQIITRTVELSNLVVVSPLSFNAVSSTLSFILGSANQVLAMNNTGTALAYHTLAKSDVGLGNVENTALSTWAGSTSITTVGTLTGLTIGTLGGVLKASLGLVSGSATLTDVSAPTADFSMNTHKLTNVVDPTTAQDAATKNYVDTSVSGTAYKEACKYATTAALPTVTYANGASGVGATLTATANGALSIDGSTPTVGQRILVKNQVAQLQNGVYTVTVVGTAGTVFVLTRATDLDQSSEIEDGTAFYVLSGTTNGGSSWVQVTTGTITFGTTSIVFSQFAGPGSILGGTGITVSGLTITVDTAWPGQTAITTLGTISTGTWQGTAIADTYISSASNWNSKQAGDATLTALAAYNTNGLLTQTAADTFTGRTLTGTTNVITVTNGDGVSGNPTVTIAATYVGQTSITTLGTIVTGVWNGTAISHTYLTGIVQADVGGLTTASSPTFAGLTVGSLTGVLKASTGAVSGSAVLNDIGAPTADFSMNTHKITNVTDPGSNQDAATKHYVDTSIASGGPVTLTGAVTGTGTGTVATTLTTPIALPSISTPSAPSAGTVDLFGQTTNGFTRLIQAAEAGTNVVLPQDMVYIAKNISGSTIAKGKPIMINGSTSGNVPTIEIADINSSSKPCEGFAMDSIANNAYGQIMRFGILTNIDTSALASSNEIYLSTPIGTLTTTRPLYPYPAQLLGKCLVSDATVGSIYVAVSTFIGGVDSRGMQTADSSSRFGDIVDALGFRVNGTTTPTTNLFLTSDGSRFIASTHSFSIDGDLTFVIPSASNLTLPGSGTVATLAGTETFTNKTLTSPKLNEAVVVTTTATELNLLHGNMGAWNTTWTPTWTGCTATVPSTSQEYVTIGKSTSVSLHVSAVGVSNSTAKTVTLPVAAKNSQGYQCWQAQDNGTNIGTAVLITRAGSNIADIYKDFNASNWTASGNWFVKFAFTYEGN